MYKTYTNFKKIVYFRAEGSQKMATLPRRIKEENKPHITFKVATLFCRSYIPKYSSFCCRLLRKTITRRKHCRDTATKTTRTNTNKKPTQPMQCTILIMEYYKYLNTYNIFLFKLNFVIYLQPKP